MQSASWTRTRIEAALALTTTADEPRVAVTSSRAPNRTLCGWTATAATLLGVVAPLPPGMATRSHGSETITS